MKYGMLLGHDLIKLVSFLIDITMTDEFSHLNGFVKEKKNLSWLAVRLLWIDF